MKDIAPKSVSEKVRHPSAAFEDPKEMAKSELNKAEGVRPYRTVMAGKTFFSIAAGKSQAESAVMARLRREAKTESLSIADMMEIIAKD